MSNMALTRTATVTKALARTKFGATPVIIGGLGAGLGLFAFTALLAPASIPMSLLGMTLGYRSRTWAVVTAGGLGLVCAAVGLLHNGVI
jgi:hypothetical protein